MIEIHAHCPAPTQIGAHLRVVSPLWDLRRTHEELHVSYEIGDCDLYRMMQADICILQRPFHSACIQKAKMAKLAECKLWIDWDDDLTSLSHSNKAWKFYQFPELKDHLDQLCDMADVITVATNRLAEVYGRHPEKVRVVPNMVEDRLIPDQPPLGERKMIMWRGSDSHMQDLAEFRDALASFARNHGPEWKFCFMGLDPEIPIYGVPQDCWRHIPECEYYDVMKIMQKFAAPIHIVPLHDNFFNRAKSNLAYIEASTAGSMVLAPNWDEWQRPGVLHYEDPEDFLHKLEWTVENLPKCRKMAEEAFEHVKTTYALSVVNRMRWDIINELTSR